MVRDDDDVAEQARRIAMKVVRSRLTAPQDGQNVDDVVQEVVLRVLSKIEQCQETFSAWVTTIAIRCVYDYLRRLRKDRRQLEMASLEDLVSDEPDIRARTDKLDVVHRALEAAAPEDRVIGQEFMEGLTTEQIAGRLGVSIRTARRKKARAFARLRKIITRLLAKEHGSG